MDQPAGAVKLPPRAVRRAASADSRSASGAREQPASRIRISGTARTPPSIPPAAPSEGLACGEIRADRLGVRGPGHVGADDEGLPLLQSEAAAQAVLQPQAAPVQLGVRAQLGPDPARVDEAGGGQREGLAEPVEAPHLRAGLDVAEQLDLAV